MASCQGSAGLANPSGEYGPEDHLRPMGPGSKQKLDPNLPAHGARVEEKFSTRTQLYHLRLWFVSPPQSESQ